MGTGLGWSLQTGGARVITTVEGRSARTRRLVDEIGIEILPSLADVVATATHLIVVTPPSAAVDAATTLAEAARQSGGRPLVADLNAISPVTVARVVEALGPLEYVDGSISGAPPTVEAGTRIFLSGPRATEFVGLPWHQVEPIDVGPTVGAASAVKMSTASVYKGLVGLLAQAVRSADQHEVLEPVLAELARSGYGQLARSVAVAATKAHRYVPEMREIAATQEAAGLTPALFTAFAEVYRDVAGTALADGDPESVPADLTAADIVKRLHTSTQ